MNRIAKNSILVLLILAVALIVTESVFAQSQSRFRRTTRSSSNNSGTNTVREDGKRVIYKKRNVVDFDDSLIEGEVNNPSEFYFVHRPEEKFGTLVKRRGNFHKEMLRDTVMIR